MGPWRDSSHTPDALPMARFEPPSRGTAGCAQNPAPTGDSCLATQQQPSAPHRPALATQSPPDPAKPRTDTPPKDEESLRRFCEGGDTTGHRDLHTHTQTAVRTRQDTVYSAWPHGAAHPGARSAIPEVPVPWAGFARDTCPKQIFPAANPGQRLADGVSDSNGTTTER